MRKFQGVQITNVYAPGDSRVNEQPLLTALHTVWVREHNRLAAALHQMNPQWDDERLFQEARKITIAEYQHITYNEWSPVLLGAFFVHARLEKQKPQLKLLSRI